MPVPTQTAPILSVTDLESTIQECPNCGTRVDLSRYEPLKEIACPVCQGRILVQGKIDRFSLRGVLGQGGTGMVYQAHDPHLGRLVALKVVRQDKAANEEVLQQILAEAGITASVNHPNVVRVFSVGDAQGRLFIAMELVGGGSLDDLMGKMGPMPEAQVLEIAIQIASGLQAAHNVGLVHRDIKPGNILFSDPRTAKLADFGLAIFEQHAAPTGEIWGTPYYMPPERLRGEAEDLRGDIYALGATLFHALAGRPPFEAKDSTQVAVKRLHSPAPSILTFAPGISNATAFVIKKMLEAGPAARFPNYEELIESLQFARNELASKPKGKARVVVDSEQSSKSNMWMTLACLGVLAGAMVGGLFLFSGKKKTETAPEAAAETPAGNPPATAPVPSPAAAMSAPLRRGDKPVVDLGIYVIANRKDSHVLDVVNYALTSGSEVSVWGRNTGGKTDKGSNQQWIVKPARDGTCRIFSSWNFKSLDVRNGSSDDKAEIAVWTPNAGVAQKWRFREMEPGWFAIFAECSGKALTAIPNRPEGGSSLGQRTYKGTPEQLWRFDLVSELTDNLDLIDPAVTPTLVDPPVAKVRTLTGSINPRFVPIDFSSVATADTRKGLYTSQTGNDQIVQAQLRGPVEVNGVPFIIGEPARMPLGMDIIVLRGGSGYAKTGYPQKVEIPVGGVPLSRLHVVGGIGSWAYPWTANGETDKHLGMPAAKMTIVFEGGGSQEIVLRNGYEICDRVDRGQVAAGSAKIEGFAKGKDELRYFSKPVTDARPVEKIVLESYLNHIAPTFFALTGEKR